MRRPRLIFCQVAVMACFVFFLPWAGLSYRWLQQNRNSALLLTARAQEVCGRRPSGRPCCDRNIIICGKHLTSWRPDFIKSPATTRNSICARELSAAFSSKRAPCVHVSEPLRNRKDVSSPRTPFEAPGPFCFSFFLSPCGTSVQGLISSVTLLAAC